MILKLSDPWPSKTFSGWIFWRNLCELKIDGFIRSAVRHVLGPLKVEADSFICYCPHSTAFSLHCWCKHSQSDWTYCFCYCFFIQCLTDDFFHPYLLTLLHFKQLAKHVSRSVKLPVSWRSSDKFWFNAFFPPCRTLRFFRVRGWHSRKDNPVIYAIVFFPRGSEFTARAKKFHVDSRDPKHSAKQPPTFF